MHTDETLDPDADGLSILAEMVTTTGFAHPVTASHCVSLSMRADADQDRVAEAVAAAGIAVVALPATNLYLQGRDRQQAMPRGVTAVRALQRAGVTVAAGADNLQDPFNPVGRACPFETAALMVLTAHLQPVDAWNTVSEAAARATGFGAATVANGRPGRPARGAGRVATRGDRVRSGRPHRVASRRAPGWSVAARRRRP